MVLQVGVAVVDGVAKAVVSRLHVEGEAFAAVVGAVVGRGLDNVSVGVSVLDTASV